jgi:MiaB/RimO family radical SAM methylthiotransferase
VNTCGFVESAKKDSVDALLAASDSAQASGAKVVAVGCMAERYGVELAESLPEADAVLGFDHYASLDERLEDLIAGRSVASHQPTDRRTLLPISPVQRPAAAETVAVPGHGWGPRVLRSRLDSAPVAALKIASGCDRRCSFCAIPSFRGSFVSRRPHELIKEAAWLGGDGVRELILVSENSTSYGKDLGDLRLLETVLPELAKAAGVVRVRVSYLQPAEVRPGLIEAMASNPGVAPYFDLSFQHASGPVLRRMRRFGDRARFIDLIERIRQLAPDAGVRSNFIVGFPGETAEDLRELELFLNEARLDAIGVFGYSDEDGTEAAGFADEDKLPQDEVDRRVRYFHDLADELMSQRAEDRIGETVEVLIEDATGDGEYEGRAAHQGPDDGSTTVLADRPLAPGDLVTARVVESLGADLVAHA